MRWIRHNFRSTNLLLLPQQEDNLLLRESRRKELITQKVAMIGLWGVGKTSLVRQFVNQMFDEKYLATLGVKIDKKQLKVQNQDLTMVLWDIAGAEDKFSVPMHYVKGSAGYLLVIDGTRSESLTAAQDLIELINKEVGPLPYVIAVNKNDLPWEISSADLEESGIAQHWFSTSAKSGENVEAAFSALAEQILNNG